MRYLHTEQLALPIRTKIGMMCSLDNRIQCRLCRQWILNGPKYKLGLSIMQYNNSRSEICKIWDQAASKVHFIGYTLTAFDYVRPVRCRNDICRLQGRHILALALFNGHQNRLIDVTYLTLRSTIQWPADEK
jgi:hypothetical protein